MPKLPPITPEQRACAVAAVAAAWEAFSPVASPPHDTLAVVCIRRWRTIQRSGVDYRDRKKTIRDMALGIIAAVAPEQELKLIGPLIVDYEYVAECVFDALENGPW